MAERVSGAVWGEPGGIVALTGLIEKHRGAFDYDWRTRFGLGTEDIGGRMSWGEATRQTRTLSLDPSSHIAAALAGWEYPVSREALVLMDLFDLQHISKAKRKPSPYPRPKVRQARTAARQALIERRLRAMGHGDLLDRL